MSVVTALARIDEIQQRIRTLTSEAAAPAPGAGASGASSPVTADAFASAVRDVLGTATLGDGSVTGEDVVAQAMTYLGVPYVFGGEDASGMDCSGLVQRVLADLGIDVPRVVQDQADVGVEVGSLAEARPGDLLVTNGEKHIVIYAGDGKIIHAPYPGKNVELRNNYLTDADIQTIRRVVPAPGEAVAAVATGPAPASAQVASANAALPAALAAALSATAPRTAAAPGVPATVGAAAASAGGGSRSVGPGAAVTTPAAAAATAASFADAAAATLTGASAPPAVADAPPPAPAAAAARTALAPQVTAPVLSLAKAPEGEHTLTLRVTPDNLGPVTVKAQITATSMTVELASPSDLGRDALRALLVDLRRDLASLVPHAALSVATADTSTGSGSASGNPWSTGAGSGSSQGQHGGGAAGTPARSGTLAEAAPAPAPPTAPTVAGSGIDLFA
ncbi:MULTISPECIES: NlpC/P60 family protein [Microbacterium]|uniref:NlpC/P60 family protein n=1 Tax=Microbacterium TaxID=33882 RepID=UPI00214B9227|nr:MULTISPECIES: NlpC/P60 family protein [unclassified Microbacterium]MCR2813983.1 NlpC/P60 family protein [Microbacterium sp. zg.Y1084]MDL5487174.1 NlpC/P60 family protein [Microbacterium sp. zg-Y1211]